MWPAGLAWLKAVGAPLAGLRFCPTGGIGAGTAPAYLALAECRLRRRIVGGAAGMPWLQGLGAASSGLPPQPPTLKRP